MDSLELEEKRRIHIEVKDLLIVIQFTYEGVIIDLFEKDAINDEDYTGGALDGLWKLYCDMGDGGFGLVDIANMETNTTVKVRGLSVEDKKWSDLKIHLLFRLEYENEDEFRETLDNRDIAKTYDEILIRVRLEDEFALIEIFEIQDDESLERLVCQKETYQSMGFRLVPVELDE